MLENFPLFANEHPFALPPLVVFAQSDVRIKKAACDFFWPFEPKLCSASPCKKVNLPAFIFSNSACG
jgi:hypothetical protein